MQWDVACVCLDCGEGEEGCVCLVGFLPWLIAKKKNHEVPLIPLSVGKNVFESKAF